MRSLLSLTSSTGNSPKSAVRSESEFRKFIENPNLALVKQVIDIFKTSQVLTEFGYLYSSHWNQHSNLVHAEYDNFLICLRTQCMRKEKELDNQYKLLVHDEHGGVKAHPIISSLVRILYYGLGNRRDLCIAVIYVLRTLGYQGHASMMTIRGINGRHYLHDAIIISQSKIPSEFCYHLHDCPEDAIVIDPSLGSYYSAKAYLSSVEMFELTRAHPVNIIEIYDKTFGCDLLPAIKQSCENLYFVMKDEFTDLLKTQPNWRKQCISFELTRHKGLAKPNMTKNLHPINTIPEEIKNNPEPNVPTGWPKPDLARYANIGEFQERSMPVSLTRKKIPDDALNTALGQAFLQQCLQDAKEGVSLELSDFSSSIRACAPDAVKILGKCFAQRIRQQFNRFALFDLLEDEINNLPGKMTLSMSDELLTSIRENIFLLNPRDEERFHNSVNGVFDNGFKTVMIGKFSFFAGEKADASSQEQTVTVINENQQSLSYVREQLEDRLNDYAFFIKNDINISKLTKIVSVYFNAFATLLFPHDIPKRQEALLSSDFYRDYVSLKKCLLTSDELANIENTKKLFTLFYDYIEETSDNTAIKDRNFYEVINASHEVMCRYHSDIDCITMPVSRERMIKSGKYMQAICLLQNIRRFTCYVEHKTHIEYIDAAEIYHDSIDSISSLMREYLAQFLRNTCCDVEVKITEQGFFFCFRLFVNNSNVDTTLKRLDRYTEQSQLEVLPSKLLHHKCIEIQNMRLRDVVCDMQLISEKYSKPCLEEIEHRHCDYRP